MIADRADMAQRGDRRRGVLQQRLAEGGIGPGPGDDGCAVARADLGLVGLDDGIERRRIDVAFLGQNGLQRADAALSLRQFRAMLVMRVVIVVCHGIGLPRNRDRHRSRGAREGQDSQKRSRLPTASGTSLRSPNWLASAVMARQPVQ